MAITKVTRHNIPYFRATVNGTQTIATGTYTKVEFDTDVFDIDGTFSTTNKRFTPTVAGYYFLQAHINFNTATDAAYFQCVIYKNASALAGFNNENFNYGSTGVCVVDLADADDYYEVYVYHNTGGDADLGDSTVFNIFSGFKLIT